MVRTTISLPDFERKRVQELADKEQRSFSNMVVVLIREGIITYAGLELTKRIKSQKEEKR